MPRWGKSERVRPSTERRRLLNRLQAAKDALASAREVLARARADGYERRVALTIGRIERLELEVRDLEAEVKPGKTLDWKWRSL